MMLTTNFSIGEFTRTSHAEFQKENEADGTKYLHNILAVAVELQKLRDFIYRAVFITSGIRCPPLNKVIGGSPNSQHIVGGAADFTVRDFDDSKGLEFVFNWCLYQLDYGQIILERPEGHKPWIHLGIPRPGRERTAYYFNGKVYVKAEDVCGNQRTAVRARLK